MNRILFICVYSELHVLETEKKKYTMEKITKDNPKVNYQTLSQRIISEFHFESKGKDDLC